MAIPDWNLVTIPDSFDMVKASLAEPAACSLHTLNRAQLQSPRPLADLRALVIGSVVRDGPFIGPDRPALQLLIGAAIPESREE